MIHNRRGELEQELASHLETAARARDRAATLQEYWAQNLMEDRLKERDASLERVRQIAAELAIYDRLANRRADRVKVALGIAGFGISLLTLAWRLLDLRGGH